MALYLSDVVFISCGRSTHNREFAFRAAALGCDVYCGITDLTQIDDMVAANVTPIQMDVASENSVAGATKTVLKSAGRIDHIFYTSHHNSFGDLEDHDATDAHYQFHVNLFGAIRLLRAFGPFLRSQKGGTYTICSAGNMKAGLMASGWHNACEAAIASIAETAKAEFENFNVTLNHMLIELGAGKNIKRYKSYNYDNAIPKANPARHHTNIMTGDEFVQAAIMMVQSSSTSGSQPAGLSRHDWNNWLGIATGLRKLLS